MLAMVERMAAAVQAPRACASREEVEETAAFLEWLRDGHFILLGARVYDMGEGPAGATVQVEAGSGLGILRDDGSRASPSRRPSRSCPSSCASASCPKATCS